MTNCTMIIFFFDCMYTYNLIWIITYFKKFNIVLNLASQEISSGILASRKYYYEIIDYIIILCTKVLRCSLFKLIQSCKVSGVAFPWKIKLFIYRLK